MEHPSLALRLPSVALGASGGSPEPDATGDRLPNHGLRLACGLFTARPDAYYASYCGQTALSALTGTPIAEICEDICSVRRSPEAPLILRMRGSSLQKVRSVSPMAIQTTYFWELDHWLRQRHTILDSGTFRKSKMASGSKLAFQFNMNPTLSTFVRTLAQRDTSYLLRVEGHFIAIRNGYVCDTNYRTPRPISGSCHVRKRISHWLSVRIHEKSA